MRRGRRGPHPPMRDGARRDPLKRAAAAPPGDAGGSPRRRPPPPSEFLSRLPRAHLPAVRAPRAGTCEPPNRRRAIALRHRRRSASPLARARRSPAPFADRAASRLPPPLGDRCRTRTRERCAGRPAQPRIVFPISSSRYRPPDSGSARCPDGAAEIGGEPISDATRTSIASRLRRAPSPVHSRGMPNHRRALSRSVRVTFLHQTAATDSTRRATLLRRRASLRARARTRSPRRSGHHASPAASIPFTRIFRSGAFQSRSNRPAGIVQYRLFPRRPNAGRLK
ncbi:hypothetical protein Y023_401 [Burkholderia pseudomallei A79D]|nr:hypothetical protein X995_4934 [Burkholderia pseudomallei B03]AIV93543.1 hypothetical protein X996_3570 [Burkholderia pseudomallei A79A]KGY02588.1 hypothetical protein Y023_401 [Burkholderia pseudomallei A79D]KGY03764.1 hypothetical protein X997_396 [Burkholderia pseudomallei A79C]